MRLINTTSLKLDDFFAKKPPPYAILSHTWGDEEVTFQQFKGESALIRNKAGFKKIVDSCRVAQEDGYEYIWIDTCCIDKTSSSELSEAINSMYRWYKGSDVCYAYLADVHDVDVDWIGETEFCRSKWFTRGWTLQELIAPQRLTLYNSVWEKLGTKKTLEHNIHRITKIHKLILKNGTLQDCSVAQKMSWAAKRTTTRPEDRAYSLMGLFDVQMPLLYGEGDLAFIRLQEEIIRRSDDHSIFAWTSRLERPILEEAGLFLPSPSHFEYSDDIVRVPNEEAQPFNLTNRGISLDLPVLSDGLLDRVVLDCKRGKIGERDRLTITLVEPTRDRNNPGRSRYVGQALEAYFPEIYDTVAPRVEYHRMLLRAYSTTTPAVDARYEALFVHIGKNLKAMGGQVTETLPAKLKAGDFCSMSPDDFGKWDAGLQVEYRNGIRKRRFDLAIRIHHSNMEIQLRETDKVGRFQSKFNSDSLRRTISDTVVNSDGEVDRARFEMGKRHGLGWSIPDMMIEAAAEHRLIDGQKCLWIIVDWVKNDRSWGQYVRDCTRHLSHLIDDLVELPDRGDILKFLYNALYAICVSVVLDIFVFPLLDRFALSFIRLDFPYKSDLKESLVIIACVISTPKDTLRCGKWHRNTPDW